MRQQIEYNGTIYKNMTVMARQLGMCPRLLRNRARKYGLNAAIELTTLSKSEWRIWLGQERKTPSELGLCEPHVAVKVKPMPKPAIKKAPIKDVPAYDPDYELKNKAASLIAKYGMDGATARLQNR